MDPLQKKEFELLELFVDICDRLDLRYYLICGSALGAVKYKGFIPWDDDVDVGLFREDYETFLEKAPEFLPEHVFLQNYRTDPAFPAIFSKLRDSETTYIERSSSKLPINHGIYIDVFPLDGYPEDRSEQNRLERRKQIYRRLLSTAYLPNRKWKWLFIFPFRLLGVHKRSASLARRYEAMISAYKTEGSEIIANHGNWQGKLEYAPESQYGSGVIGEFEGLNVRLPENYDAYLRQKYGDYTLDPPPEEQVGHHYNVACDCDKPYTEYTDLGAKSPNDTIKSQRRKNTE